MHAPGSLLVALVHGGSAQSVNTVGCTPVGGGALSCAPSVHVTLRRCLAWRVRQRPTNFIRSFLLRGQCNAHALFLIIIFFLSSNNLLYLIFANLPRRLLRQYIHLSLLGTFGQQIGGSFRGTPRTIQIISLSLPQQRRRGRRCGSKHTANSDQSGKINPPLHNLLFTQSVKWGRQSSLLFGLPPFESIIGLNILNMLS